MKKLTINHLLIAGLLSSSAAMLSGCAGDYLDVKNTQGVETNTAFGTTDKVKSSVNGIAKTMHTLYYGISSNYVLFGLNGEGMVIDWFGEWCGQDNVNGLWENQANYNKVFSGDVFNVAGNVIISYPWKYYYTVITNANSVILHAEEAVGNAGLNKFYKAEALTFRAYAYSRLVQLYGKRWQDSNNGSTPGVVLRLDESTESNKPVSTLKECYDQVYKDCKDAIALYQEAGVDREKGEFWMPNINVACLVLARTALTRQDYETALQYAPLAREGYPLMSEADYVAGFATPTCEWIWGSTNSSTETLGHGDFAAINACNGYNANTYSTRNNKVNLDLVAAIPATDVRSKLFLTQDKFPDYDFNADDGKNYTNVDSYGRVTGDELNTAMVAYIKGMTPKGFSQAYPQAALVGGQLKFWSTDGNGESCVPYMRSAETYLIEAEANYFLNNEDAARTALTTLNKARNAAYTCDLTGEALFEEIFNYRRIELWGEGFNWFDFKRLRRTIERKTFRNGGATNIYTNSAALRNIIKPDDKNGWTLVYPSGETNFNEDVIN